MDRIELEKKRDKNTKKDIAEKLELTFNTNMVTKEKLFKNLLPKI